MDTNNCREAQDDQPQPPAHMDANWRSALRPDSRSKIVNKILGTLKKHLPYSGQEGLKELKNVAERFEDKIYTGATSQSDYLRKISLKMLTIESKSQNALPNMPPNSADPASSQNMQPQLNNQDQSVPLQMVSNQSQPCPLMAQNMQNNVASAGVQSAPSMLNSLPPVSALTQNPMPNVPQNPNLQAISGISQNSMGNTMNQSVASNMFVAQRQMQGRQQVGLQQQQPQNSQQQCMYQQHVKHQLLKHKLQAQGNMQHQLMQTPMQQQQPPQQQSNLLQATQLQSFPPKMVLTSSNMQPSMVSEMQQNQQTTMQQPQAVLQLQQSMLRQQQQQQQQQPHQTPGVPQPESQSSQQKMVPLQQQPQLMSQQQNTVSMQQNQLLGQQSRISDMQQEQLLQLQQQLAHQSHVGGLPQQQQLIGSLSGDAGMETNQHTVHLMQQVKAPMQQQSQNASSLLSGGGQQMMSQMQSQLKQLQQQLGMQQKSNSVPHNMQQRFQLLQQQKMIDQKLFQLLQQRRATPEGPSTSLDSTAQTSNTNAGDWQEEVYQKIKAMKDMYLADLDEMNQKIFMKLQQEQPKEQHDKLRLFKQMLERLLQVLRISKTDILPGHKDKLCSYEKQIVNLLNSHRLRKPIVPIQPGQMLTPQQPLQQPILPMQPGQMLAPQQPMQKPILPMQPGQILAPQQPLQKPIFPVQPGQILAPQQLMQKPILPGQILALQQPLQKPIFPMQPGQILAPQQPMQKPILPMLPGKMLAPQQPMQQPHSQLTQHTDHFGSLVILLLLIIIILLIIFLTTSCVEVKLNYQSL